jgi:hypothetical protein
MLNARDQSILEHIALYRVSIRRAISLACLGGRDCGQIIQDLLTDGYVTSEQTLAQRRSCYRLTRKATEHLGLPESMARIDAGKALHVNLAILCRCILQEPQPAQPQSRRLSLAELESLFPEQIPEAAHIIESSPAGNRVMRVYVPGADTKTKAIAHWIRGMLAKSNANPILRPWIEQRKYGIAILVHTEGRRARLSRLLRTGGAAGTHNAAPQAEAVFSVHCVPNLMTDTLP